jgi:hypothetical protein
MRIPFLSALTLVFALGGSASAMTYSLTTLDDGRCGDRCPQAIVAEGSIQVDEAQRLLAFISQVGGQGLPDTVVLRSPGGNLAGALRLGYGLRQIGVRTVVNGVCASACVFVLMGGSQRVVPAGSRIIVHAARRYGGVQRDIVGPGFIDGQGTSESVLPLLYRYAADMGVDPAIMSLAQSVPHESARQLTPAEISRFRLATVSGGGRPAIRGGGRRPVRAAAARRR